MKELERTSILENIYNSSLDAIIITDEMGYITEANKAFMELVGYKKEEVIGKHMSAFSPTKEGSFECSTGELIQIDKKFSDYIKSSMNQFIEKGKLRNAMGYQLRKDGKVVPVEDNMVFLSDKKGERIGAFAIIRDITQRKQAEQETITAKEFFENIFKTSVDGIMITDSFGKVTMVNSAVEKMFNCKRDKLIGMHTAEFEEKRHQKSGLTLMEKLLSQGALSGVERTWLKMDGGTFNVETNIGLLKDYRGDIVGSVASIRDITERKRAEESLKKSEEKYYNLIEHANDAIVSINREGMIIGFNRTAENMFGYSREELLGKPAYVLAPPEKREDQKKVLEGYRKSGKIEKRFMEGIGLRKNGQEFFSEFSFNTVDIHGELIATATIRDISERKESEQKLIDYQKQLRSLTSRITLTEEQERRRFAEFLHDEIGQQLFATRLQLELLKGSLSSSQNIKELDIALKNIGNVMEQTRSLTFELSSPILYELGLEKALVWLTEQARKKYNIKIAFKDDKKKKPLDDDMKIFLYQAVRELIVNIAKHAQTKKATVSIKKDNSNIRICVEDNGVGFTFQNNNSIDAKIEGFGLFHIAERLEQFGGKLEIESQPNHGTSITIVAPLGKSGDLN